MTMPEAVKSVLSKYATFSGRAGGTEYWWYVVFQLLVIAVAAIIDTVLFGRQSLLSGICSLGLLLPSLAVAARRLHDTNRSGWWLLLGLIPIVGSIVLIIWLAAPSTAGPNRFGPMPGAVSEGGVSIS